MPGVGKWTYSNLHSEGDTPICTESNIKLAQRKFHNIGKSQKVKLSSCFALTSSLQKWLSGSQKQSTYHSSIHNTTEPVFLDVVGTKGLTVFLLTIQWILPPLPPSKSCLNIVCNVNIVYRNLKSENSQLKIVPRNLNEIVRSSIPFQDCAPVQCTFSHLFTQHLT